MHLQQHHRPRMACLAALAATLAIGFAARADTVVVPNNLATDDSNFGSGLLRAANYRGQAVYGAANFPSDIALLITELRFRPDRAIGTAFTTTVANIQFNLSTTTRNPESLSSTFANNVGADDTVVLSGSLTISSQFTGPAGGPKDFDIVVPLATPFLYNPAAGNLLVDVRNVSGSSASALSGGNLSNDAASRAGGSLSSAVGGVDHAVEALQIVYTPVNQPPSPLLLTRGPYLQNATTTNIVVRWRTSQPTNAVVQFGLTDAALTWAVTNDLRTNDHTVVLTNLAPDTKYFYAIGAGETNLAGDATCFFQTLPSAPRPVRIWAMGDFGTTGRYGNGAAQVRDAYYNFATNRYTDVWLMLGDNAYDYGTDDDYQRAVFDVYQTMLRKTVAWSCIGNHETYGSNALGHIAYYDIFNLPMQGEAGGVPSGTIHYYSFDYANIHFVSLDSELSDQTDAGPMATWLREDLMANTNEWLIVFWHSPPYTKGSHNSDSLLDTDGHMVNMRQVFVPILESFGVDLVLSGHSHIYERSYLLRGHYGMSDTFEPSMAADSGSGQPGDSGPYLKPGASGGTDGGVFVVAGSGGFATFTTGRHPAMYAALLQPGSLVLDVNSNRLDAKFLRSDGVIADSFTMIKGAAAEPLKIKTTRIAGGNVTLQFKTIAGKTYQIERATHLGPADWMPVGGDIIATGATTKWMAVLPEGSGASFYRAVLVSD